MDSLSDVILFDVPTSSNARALEFHLALEGGTRRTHGLDSCILSVDIDEATDLARLLRRAEEWVAKSGLGAIQYHLDDRSYVLEAGETIWSSLFPGEGQAVEKQL